MTVGPKLLADLADKKKCELISLENRNRKKFVAKTGESEPDLCVNILMF
jgi:hypothetical protein